MEASENRQKAEPSQRTNALAEALSEQIWFERRCNQYDPHRQERYRCRALDDAECESRCAVDTPNAFLKKTGEGSLPRSNRILAKDRSRTAKIQNDSRKVATPVETGYIFFNGVPGSTSPACDFSSARRGGPAALLFRSDLRGSVSYRSRSCVRVALQEHDLIRWSRA